MQGKSNPNDWTHEDAALALVVGSVIVAGVVVALLYLADCARVVEVIVGEP